MRVVLVGYPGSQKLVPVTRFLAEKYLPGFNIEFLNYIPDPVWGDTPIRGWSLFVLEYLKTLQDEKIIFGLDDYLIRNPIDAKNYTKALELSNQYESVKLCPCTPEEQNQYPVTTQLTIWHMDVLKRLLLQCGSPWDFETRGSKLFEGKSIVCPCLDYDVHSALSARWQGLNLKGIKQEDLDEIEKIL